MIDLVKDVIPAIQQKMADTNTYFRCVREGVYLTRCCFCGDSQDRRKAHMYLLINDSGCTCYCHKCNRSTQLTSEVLTMLIGEHNFNLSGQKVRRINPGNPTTVIETDVLHTTSPAYKYLKARIGCDFTPDEMIALRIIADQRSFIEKYNIRNIEVVPNVITFITADGNTLCYRNLIENDSFRWLKKKVYPKYESCPYTIRSSIDTLSDEPIVVVMAEGIFDVIGVYKNVTSSANLYAASLGKDYSSVIRWMISKGIFGKNVSICIYSDNDVPISKLRGMLRRYRWIFGQISVIFNDAGHDFGVPKDQIILRDPIII